MTVVRMNKAQQTETDIAVLQVQVKNVEDKIGDLKEDMKGMRTALDDHSDNASKMMKELQDSNSYAIKSVSEKVSALEKWRWMMMGAGVALGALGYDAIAKLLH